MEKPEVVSKSPRRGRRVLIAFVLTIGVLIGWHLYLSIGLSNRVRALRSASTGSKHECSISVNPLTNLVSIKVPMPPAVDDENPDASLGSAVGLAIGGAMIQAIAPNFIERELNTRAREQYDFYAMLVPYCVRISIEPASAEAIARIRAQREQRRAEEDRLKAEAERSKAEAEAERLRSIGAYISSSLSLEGLRVAPSQGFFRTVDGVFGTIVNKGAEPLSKVTLRIFFLDDTGRRIGEKDLSPLLIKGLSSLGDSSPLRSEYRRDFAVDVEDDAPAGWAKKIEVEIVDIEFGEPWG